MKLLNQILTELGADTAKSMTIVPGFGGYFGNVKGVAEFSPTGVTLELRKGRIVIEGSKLKVGEYFEGDILIRGEIKAVKIEGVE